VGGALGTSVGGVAGAVASDTLGTIVCMARAPEGLGGGVCVCCWRVVVRIRWKACAYWLRGGTTEKLLPLKEEF